MSLTFPNPSRSYDVAGQRVRFHGHDGMFEIVFLIDVKAFAEAAAEVVPSETECLAAFDAARGSIYAVAREVYSIPTVARTCTRSTPGKDGTASAVCGTGARGVRMWADARRERGT